MNNVQKCLDTKNRYLLFLQVGMEASHLLLSKIRTKCIAGILTPFGSWTKKAFSVPLLWSNVGLVVPARAKLVENQIERHDCGNEV